MQNTNDFAHAVAHEFISESGFTNIEYINTSYPNSYDTYMTFRIPSDSSGFLDLYFNSDTDEKLENDIYSFLANPSEIAANLSPAAISKLHALFPDYI